MVNKQEAFWNRKGDPMQEALCTYQSLLAEGRKVEAYCGWASANYSVRMRYLRRFFPLMREAKRAARSVFIEKGVEYKSLTPSQFDVLATIAYAWPWRDWELAEEMTLLGIEKYEIGKVETLPHCKALLQLGFARCMIYQGRINEAMLAATFARNLLPFIAEQGGGDEEAQLYADRQMIRVVRGIGEIFALCGRPWLECSTWFDEAEGLAEKTESLDQLKKVRFARWKYRLISRFRRPPKLNMDV